MPLPRLWLEDYASPKIFFYSAGTTTKINAYTTSALSVALANPLSADANGLFAAIYFDPALSYKVVVAPSTDTDPPTNAIYEQDNMTAAAAVAGILAVLSKTADYVVVATDGDDVIVLVDATLGAVAITLYTAVGNTGKKIRVVKTDNSVNAVTIDPNGSQTWGGATTRVLNAQYEAASGVSDAANWVEFGRIRPINDAEIIYASQFFS